MNVLLVSFYFPPDLSAGSFRAAALVEALLRRCGPDARIDVLTSTPNRYASHDRGGADETHPDPRVRVVRAAVPPHRSGVGDQARSFAVFARTAYREALRSDPDIVVATSSRLFSAALGAVIARRLAKPLYLDIRDIFSETISGVFAGRAIRTALPAISRLERWTLRRARRINVVSPAFVDYFAPIVGHRDFAQFTNGIDDLFLEPVAPRGRAADEDPVVLIAGNIGEGQGLHHVLPAMARAVPKARFRVIGDGGRREALAQALAAAGVTNVELLRPVARKLLLEEYARAAVLFTHLNDLPAFQRVLPSKLFEYGASGLPVLAGAVGFARRFVEDEIPGSAVFDPCDAEGGAAALRGLLSGPARFDRSAFRARFGRAAIMDAMADDILATARP